MCPTTTNNGGSDLCGHNRSGCDNCVTVDNLTGAFKCCRCKCVTLAPLDKKDTSQTWVCQHKLSEERVTDANHKSVCGHEYCTENVVSLLPFSPSVLVWRCCTCSRLVYSDEVELSKIILGTRSDDSA